MPAGENTPPAGGCDPQYWNDFDEPSESPAAPPGIVVFPDSQVFQSVHVVNFKSMRGAPPEITDYRY